MSNSTSKDFPIQELGTLIDASDMAVAVGTPDGLVTFVNQGFTRLFGYTGEETIGRRTGELLGGEHTDRNEIARLRGSLKQRGSTHSELLLYPKTGRPLWISMVSTSIFDANGACSHLVAVMTDITQSKIHEVLQGNVLNALGHDRPLKEVMEILCREVESIAPDMVVSIVSVDTQGKMRLLAAPSLPPSYGESVEGMPIGTAAWRRKTRVVTDIEHDPLWAGSRHLALPFGLLSGWSGPIKAGDGRVLGSFSFYYRDKRTPDAFHLKLAEISLYLCALALEREEARTRIHQLAYTDALTSLPNRLMLISQAERALEEVRREESEMAVLFMDMDRFKQINDKQGHAAGDAILRQMAACLMAVMRKADIAGRYAGDEFVAVLPRCNAEQTLAITERLMEAFATPIRFNDTEIKTGVSIGVAMYPADGQDLATLLSRADVALYQAKNNGRNQVRFFNHEMDRAARERIALEAALRSALQEQDGLSLVYQPQRDAGGRLYGMEALLRWRHPELGAVMPDRFIPVAEESGLIKPLTRWVLNEACRQLAAWRADGMDIPRVSVNVSVTDFTDAGFPQFLAWTLQQHGLQPLDLILEITESTMLDKRASVMAVIEALHAFGIRMSLDDFGTGYSSLSYLHRLPISEIKLDKSFVQDLESNATAQALVHTMLGIGRNLGLTVVAEGVETDAQHAFLVERGCQVLQGYLITRPLPPDELAGWLRAPTPPTRTRISG
jgi:diguanylate cyclase (GGDEF)-like protein/PAS domain S-box-containing protein